MQRFRFLLPLFILTLAVLGITVSLRTLSNKNASPVAETGQTSSSSGESSEGSQTQTEGTVEGEQNKGLISKIVSIIKPKPTSTSTSSSTGGSGQPAQTVDTTFSTSQVEILPDQEKSLTIELSDDRDRPTAYTFNLKYDPKVLSILRLEPGNTWDKTNVLDRVIDPNKGTATLSAGQALGSTNSSKGMTLITIYVKAKAGAAVDTMITMEDSSHFAYVGLDEEVLLKSKSIQVKVSD